MTAPVPEESYPSGVRRAAPGELCDCGRQAVTVVRHMVTGEWGGVCGIDNGGVPPDGVCPFCENQLDHDEPRVNEDGDVVGVFRQGGKCPRYRLRLDDAPEPVELDAADGRPA